LKRSPQQAGFFFPSTSSIAQFLAAHLKTGVPQSLPLQATGGQFVPIVACFGIPQAIQRCPSFHTGGHNGKRRIN
jgi:hypothetical protein